METTDPSGQNLENTGKESPHYFYDIFFGKIQRFFGLFCASSAIIESYGGTSMPKWAWYISANLSNTTSSSYEEAQCTIERK